MCVPRGDGWSCLLTTCPVVLLSCSNPLLWPVPSHQARPVSSLLRMWHVRKAAAWFFSFSFFPVPHNNVAALWIAVYLAMHWHPSFKKKHQLLLVASCHITKGSGNLSELSLFCLFSQLSLWLFYLWHKYWRFLFTWHVLVYASTLSVSLCVSVTFKIYVWDNRTNNIMVMWVLHKTRHLLQQQ